MAISDLNIVFSTLPNCLAFPVAIEEDFAHCSQALIGLGKQIIPDEYAEFLFTISDGLSVDGMWLFGTLEHHHKSYSIPSLVTIVEQFSQFKWIQNKLVIGQFFGLLIAYNYETNDYEFINILTFEIVDKHSTLEDLIYNIISKRIEESDQ